MIDNILAWGRQNWTPGNGSVKDLTGHFNPADVEKWRRELRRRYRDGDRCVDWDHHRGYEIEVNDYEAIGLTNVRHHKGLVVYYRRKPV